MATPNTATYAPPASGIPDTFGRETRAGGVSAWPAWRALLFGLVCIEIATLAGGLATLLHVERVQGAAAVVLFAVGQTFDAAMTDGQLTWVGLAQALAIAPVVGLVILGGMALGAHLLVVILAGSRSTGFRATFRVISLTSVIHLVNWIPAIGLPLNVLGMLLATLGLRRVHKIGIFKAALIGFAPGIALLTYAALLMFAPE